MPLNVYINEYFTVHEDPNDFRKYCSRNLGRKKSAWFPCLGEFWLTRAWGALLCPVSHSYRCQGSGKDSTSHFLYKSKVLVLNYIHGLTLVSAAVIIAAGALSSRLSSPLYFVQFPFFSIPAWEAWIMLRVSPSVHYTTKVCKYVLCYGRLQITLCHLLFALQITSNAAN